MTDSLKVLIVDDHADFRRGLEALLRTTTGVETVGSAPDGVAGIEMADRLQPDVILMDLNMPNLNGVDATRTIIQTSPHIRILVLTMFDDDDSVLAALRAGARGYLLKGAGRDDMIRAIHSVANGDLILGPAIANRIVSALAVPPPRSPVEPFPELSSREREVLDLIAAGANNTTISETLFLSPKTVRNHVTSIFSKLHITERGQAIVLAHNRKRT